MASIVLTVLGDDRAGLVDALARVVADHGGNWDRSQMTRLAGKFAGIVLVTVPDDRAAALRDALGALADDGVLDVDVVDVDATSPTPRASATLAVEGPDRAGIMRDVAHVLAEHAVSIESLDTHTGEAPMAGGLVFAATAHLVVPDPVDLDQLRRAVEAAVPGHLVDLTADVPT